MARWYFGSGRAAGVRRYSGSVPTVIVVSVIARCPVERKPADGSDVLRTVATSRAPKAGKTTVIGSASTGIAGETMPG